MSEELQVRRGPGRPPLNRAETVGGALPAGTVEIPKPEEQPKQRSQRRPFGSMAQKLAYPDRPGYHRHWFNESGNRIHDALEAGYEHVNDREGKKVTRVVGTAEGGGALHAYLMEIPKDWYDEDMALEQALIAEKEASIKRGATEGAEVERGYVPSQGISIR